MGWADKAIQKLRQGKPATLKTPEYFKLIEPEEQITVTPCKPKELAVGDVILTRIKGDSYLVQIKAIEDSRFGVGGLTGTASDWIEANAIYGIAWQRKEAIFTRQELLEELETVAQEKMPPLQYFEYGPNDFQMLRTEETLWFLRGSKTDYHNALHFWVSCLQFLETRNYLNAKKEAELSLCVYMSPKAFLSLVNEYYLALKEQVALNKLGVIIRAMLINYIWYDNAALGETEQEFVALFWGTSA